MTAKQQADLMHRPLGRTMPHGSSTNCCRLGSEERGWALSARPWITRPTLYFQLSHQLTEGPQAEDDCQRCGLISDPWDGQIFVKCFEISRWKKKKNAGESWYYLECWFIKEPEHLWFPVLESEATVFSSWVHQSLKICFLITSVENKVIVEVCKE